MLLELVLFVRFHASIELLVHFLCNYLVEELLEQILIPIFYFSFVQDKLFSSKNRTEVSLGKKLKIDFLPDIEKIHKVSNSPPLSNSCRTT